MAPYLSKLEIALRAALSVIVAVGGALLIEPDFKRMVSPVVYMATVAVVAGAGALRLFVDKSTSQRTPQEPVPVTTLPNDSVEVTDAGKDGGAN